jgi:hypothetical protein
MAFIPKSADKGGGFFAQGAGAVKGPRLGLLHAAAHLGGFEHASGQRATTAGSRFYVAEGWRRQYRV